MITKALERQEILKMCGRCAFADFDRDSQWQYLGNWDDSADPGKPSRVLHQRFAAQILEKTPSRWWLPDVWMVSVQIFLDIPVLWTWTWEFFPFGTLQKTWKAPYEAHVKHAIWTWDSPSVQDVAPGSHANRTL